MSKENRKQPGVATDKAERLATELSPDTSLPPLIEESETNLGDPASYETVIAQGNETASVKAISASASGVLPAGSQFGAYQIVSLLGAGGMGEVYLARDSRLSRPVALKTLPARLMLDNERVRRFKREALAASALNHPNVLTIYEIGQAEGVDYIATEFVDGRTLRQRLAAGTMLVKEALEAAAQIASGLSAAHASGVVHRDIKPENIMLRHDGYAKILDFGIAKLIETVSGYDTLDQTSVEHYRTTPGIIIGTGAYMSPEQALGLEVDHRSDIFNLGVVLYEMLTGRRPFNGSSALSTYQSLAEWLPEQIGAKASHEELGAELDRVLSRALERDLELRYQTMADFRAELRRLQRETDSISAFSSAAYGRQTTEKKSQSHLGISLARWWKSALAIAAIILLPLAGWFAGKQYGSATPGAINATHLQLTDQGGEEIFPSISPDSKAFVYTSRSAGNADIYWQRVGGRQANNLTKDQPAEDTQPAFSPDGEQIAFRSERDGGGIFLMGATGESVRRLTDAGFNPAWSADGKEIIYAAESIENPGRRYNPRSQLWAVNVATNQKRLVSEGDAVQPSCSPTGKRIAFWGLRKSGQRDIFTIPANGGEATAVTDDAFVDWNPVWSPDGKYLYFASDRSGSMNLWRVGIDEASGKTLGQPEPISTPSSFSQHISLSRDGKHLIYAQAIIRDNLLQIGFDPLSEKPVGQTVWITQGSRPAVYADFAPGGEKLAFSSMGSRQEDIYVVNKDGKGLRQITDDPFKDRHPRWSTDGRRVAFFSARDGGYEAWLVNADGSGLEQVSFTGSGNVIYPFWSPDGAHLAYTVRNDTTYILQTANPWRQQTPQPLPKMKQGWFWACSWSPDGSAIAGWRQQPDSAASGIVIYSFATGEFEQLTEFGYEPVWLKDSRRLLFYHQGKIYLADTRSKQSRVVLSLPPHQLQATTVSNNDRTLCVSATTTEADIWLATMP